jgi:hypothetical protein
VAALRCDRGDRWPMLPVPRMERFVMVCS